jgi:histone-lysine N-methyltransferase SETMAR
MYKKLADFYFEVLKTPAYSPDLAPSDYYLFSNLKKYLKGRKFSSIEEVTSTAVGWFAAQTKEFFLDGLKNLGKLSHNCVELRGECVEQIHVLSPVQSFFFIKPKTYQHPLINDT